MITLFIVVFIINSCFTTSNNNHQINRDQERVTSNERMGSIAFLTFNATIPDTVVQSENFTILLDVNSGYNDIEILNVTIEHIVPIFGGLDPLVINITAVHEFLPANTSKMYTLQAVIPAMDPSNRWDENNYVALYDHDFLSCYLNVFYKDLRPGSLHTKVFTHFYVTAMKPFGIKYNSEKFLYIPDNGDIFDLNVSVYNNLNRTITLKNIDVYPFEGVLLEINLTHHTVNEVSGLDEQIPPRGTINYTLRVSITFENLTGVERGFLHWYILFYTNSTFSDGGRTTTVKNHIQSCINEEEEKKVTAYYFLPLLLTLTVLSRSARPGERTRGRT